MCSSILLVGAGQLGCRYLEGLIKIPTPLSICIVDPSISSLNNASSVVDSSSTLVNHSYRLQSSLSELDNFYDLAIIATSSNVRIHVITQLLQQTTISVWLLEKLLAQTLDDLISLNNLFSDLSRVYVNTPRRIMPWYQDLFLNLNQSPLTINNATVIGGNWGLACNSIHFIDLFCWLSASKVRSIKSNDLVNWFPSKRKGFFEVNGSLSVLYENSFELTIISDNSESNINIDIHSTCGTWNIDEFSGLARGPNNILIQGSLDYQSDLTPKLVSELLDSRSCGLPTLSESCLQHYHLINCLLIHWNNFNSSNTCIVPVT